MQVAGKLEYSLTVTQSELNLIGLALCGKLDPEGIVAAKELNVQLLKQKEIWLQQHLKMVQTALDQESGKPIYRGGSNDR